MAAKRKSTNTAQVNEEMVKADSLKYKGLRVRVDKLQQ